MGSMALRFNAVNRSLRCLLYWSSSATELVLHCCHLFFLPTLACDHYITFSSSWSIVIPQLPEFPLHNIALLE